MNSRRLRWGLILAVVALAAAAVNGVPSARESVLRAAGWALVVDEPLAPADVIVLSLASGGAGALEAAELVKEGIATRVAVLPTLRAETTNTSSSAEGYLMRTVARDRLAN
jgi:hypothetical protein